MNTVMVLRCARNQYNELLGFCTSYVLLHTGLCSTVRRSCTFLNFGLGFRGLGFRVAISVVNSRATGPPKGP